MDFVPVHTMKTYRSNGSTAPLINQRTRCRWDFGFKNPSLYHWGM